MNSKKQKQIEFREKIEKGLEKAYENLIEFKKKNYSELVIMRGKK